MTRKLKSWQAYSLGIGMLSAAVVLLWLGWTVSPWLIFIMFIFYGGMMIYSVIKNRHMLRVVEKPKEETKSNPV